MGGGAGDRLQQRTLIGIDHRAAQMGAVLRIERGIAALVIFGCDDSVCQFELAAKLRIHLLIVSPDASRVRCPDACDVPTSRR